MEESSLGPRARNIKSIEWEQIKSHHEFLDLTSRHDPSVMLYVQRGLVPSWEDYLKNVEWHKNIKLGPQKDTSFSKADSNPTSSTALLHIDKKNGRTHIISPPDRNNCESTLSDLSLLCQSVSTLSTLTTISCTPVPRLRVKSVESLQRQDLPPSQVDSTKDLADKPLYHGTPSTQYPNSALPFSNTPQLPSVPSWHFAPQASYTSNYSPVSAVDQSVQKGYSPCGFLPNFPQSFYHVAPQMSDLTSSVEDLYSPIQLSQRDQVYSKSKQPPVYIPSNHSAVSKNDAQILSTSALVNPTTSIPSIDLTSSGLAESAVNQSLFDRCSISEKNVRKEYPASQPRGGTEQVAKNPLESPNAIDQNSLNVSRTSQPRETPSEDFHNSYLNRILASSHKKGNKKGNTQMTHSQEETQDMRTSQLTQPQECGKKVFGKRHPAPPSSECYNKHPKKRRYISEEEQLQLKKKICDDHPAQDNCVSRESDPAKKSEVLLSVIIKCPDTGPSVKEDIPLVRESSGSRVTKDFISTDFGPTCSHSTSRNPTPSSVSPKITETVTITRILPPVTTVSSLPSRFNDMAVKGPRHMNGEKAKTSQVEPSSTDLPLNSINHSTNRFNHSSRNYLPPIISRPNSRIVHPRSTSTTSGRVVNFTKALNSVIVSALTNSENSPTLSTENSSLSTENSALPTENSFTLQTDNSLIPLSNDSSTRPTESSSSLLPDDSPAIPTEESSSLPTENASICLIENASTLSNINSCSNPTKNASSISPGNSSSSSTKIPSFRPAENPLPSSSKHPPLGTSNDIPSVSTSMSCPVSNSFQVPESNPGPSGNVAVVDVESVLKFTFKDLVTTQDLVKRKSPSKRSLPTHNNASGLLSYRLPSDKTQSMKNAVDIFKDLTSSENESMEELLNQERQYSDSAQLKGLVMELKPCEPEVSKTVASTISTSNISASKKSNKVPGIVLKRTKNDSLTQSKKSKYSVQSKGEDTNKKVSHSKVKTKLYEGKNHSHKHGNSKKKSSHLDIKQIPSSASKESQMPSVHSVKKYSQCASHVAKKHSVEKIPSENSNNFSVNELAENVKKKKATFIQNSKKYGIKPCYVVLQRNDMIDKHCTRPRGSPCLKVLPDGSLVKIKRKRHHNHSHKSRDHMGKVCPKMTEKVNKNTSNKKIGKPGIGDEAKIVQSSNVNNNTNFNRGTIPPSSVPVSGLETNTVNTASFSAVETVPSVTSSSETSLVQTFTTITSQNSSEYRAGRGSLDSGFGDEPAVQRPSLRLDLSQMKLQPIVERTAVQLKSTNFRALSCWACHRTFMSKKDWILHWESGPAPSLCPGINLTDYSTTPAPNVGIVN